MYLTLLIIDGKEFKLHNYALSVFWHYICKFQEIRFQTLTFMDFLWFMNFMIFEEMILFSDILMMYLRKCMETLLIVCKLCIKGYKSFVAFCNTRWIKIFLFLFDLFFPKLHKSLKLCITIWFPACSLQKYILQNVLLSILFLLSVKNCLYSGIPIISFCTCMYLQLTV